jgi:hypothetical protein
MRIKMTRSLARLLLAILAPILLLRRISDGLTGKPPKRSAPLDPRLLSTIRGDPFDYRGDKPVLAAIWADSSSVWKQAAFGIMKSLQAEFVDTCEFQYIEEAPGSVDLLQRCKIQVIPVILLVHRGREIDRWVKPLDGTALRAAVQSLLTERASCSDP